MSAERGVRSAECPGGQAPGGAAATARPTRVLPEYIYEQEGGYRVKIQRGAVTYRAWSGSLEKAIALRERFMVLAGPIVYAARHRSPSTAPRSNTGLHGISETVKWTNYRPHPCFSVELGKHHRPQIKRIYYGHKRTREEALAMAIQLRKSLAKEGQ